MTFSGATFATANPLEVGQWILGFIALIPLAIGIAKLIDWVGNHFASKKDLDALNERVKVLEANEQKVTDQAREEKHLRAMIDLLEKIRKDDKRSHH